MKRYLFVLLCCMFYGANAFAQTKEPTNIRILFEKKQTTVDFKATSEIWSDLANMSIDSIIGYASLDGDSMKNHQLATMRAINVGKQLKIDVGRIPIYGYGPTYEFGRTDNNRCVVIFCTAHAYTTGPPNSFYSNAYTQTGKPHRQNAFRILLHECSKNTDEYVHELDTGVNSLRQ
jgi:hypothetical protein